jgi:hypothetical protein
MSEKHATTPPEDLPLRAAQPLICIPSAQLDRLIATNEALHGIVIMLETPLSDPSRTALYKSVRVEGSGPGVDSNSTEESQAATVREKECGSSKKILVL